MTVPSHRGARNSKQLIRRLVAITAWPIIVLPTNAFAQTRGGACRSAFCEFTGGIVALVLLGLFLLSVARSIAAHGFWAGIMRHRGVQFLALYVALGGGMILLTIASFEVAGETGALVFLGLSAVILYRMSRRAGTQPKDEVSQAGCDKCWSSEASEAWKAVTGIPIEARLIDDSHYIVSIRACPICSQRYLQVTTEVVDWKDGEDPIHRTIIPIDEAEQAKLTTSKPLEASVIASIGAGRRSLKYDWPKGQDPNTYWDIGVSVGVHS